MLDEIQLKFDKFGAGTRELQDFADPNAKPLNTLSGPLLEYFSDHVKQSQLKCTF